MAGNGPDKPLARNTKRARLSALFFIGRPASIRLVGHPLHHMLLIGADSAVPFAQRSNEPPPVVGMVSALHSGENGRLVSVRGGAMSS
ncbi:hypothetical protein HDE76_002654 [Rhodanobacter sp. ANJX3]|uniref:hypothetical protein n=1 Tax=unclassified Rhodanobacter TaxID=2621553 RepID=UPI0015C797B9|nr:MULTISPECIES: hypothetical protein [unclassified Rhodanobacter]MBB5359425.1 hypothetical protein [Rhodanobacter sp. ANJX3]NYE29822.1 hypothetical protein [Rhodanobacter sp. K2T2]